MLIMLSSSTGLALAAGRPADISDRYLDRVLDGRDSALLTEFGIHDVSESSARPCDDRESARPASSDTPTRSRVASSSNPTRVVAALPMP
jgi:hypothetical protein